MTSFDITLKSTPLPPRLFLEASAGTGKTFTIEHLVIRLLLETDFLLEQIVVVTFTRAATRELRDRIKSNLERVLAGETTFEYIRDISPAQKEKLKTSLALFDQAQIFTIHGFCFRLLQEFAFEADVGFELQDWDNPEERWALLQFLRKTEAVTPHQLKRLMGFCRNDLELLIEKLLSADGNVSIPTMPKLSFFPVSSVFEEIRIHYKGMTSPSFSKQANIVEKALKRGEYLPEEWDYLIGEKELFLEGLEPTNLKAKSKFPGHPAMEQLRELFQEARSPRKILKILAKHWTETKKELSLDGEQISPDDLLKKVSERLSDTTFVEKIRKKYRAVIVDEFQDTDPIQWKIFETLFFNEPEKSIYLVGDPKQSIYAFRKADIYTFLQAQNLFVQKGELRTNFRSSPHLLESLNRLFCNQPWMDLPRLNLHLQIPPLKSAKEGEGDVCFMVVEESLKSGKKWPTLSIETDYFFPFIVHEICRLNLDPSHVAILVKDRYQAARLKNYLDRWNFPSCLMRSGSLGDSLILELLEELIEACFGIGSIKKVLLGPLVGLPLENLMDHFGSFSECAEIWEKSGFSAFMAHFLQIYPGLDPILYRDLLEVIEKIGFIRDPHQMLKSLSLLKIHEQDDRISAHPQGIQIMTTHASKGLEFETVFALGMMVRTPSDDENVREQDAEKMRQLYVALTRAKTRLYIPYLKEMSGKSFDPGEGSPMELFFSRVSPDINSFNRVFLNEMEFQLKSYEKAPITPTPLPANLKFFKPLFLHSFSSLSDAMPEKKVMMSPLVPAGSETGLIVHRIFEQFFNRTSTLSEIIKNEIRGTHLENLEAALHDMIEKTLDLPLHDFSLRAIDPSLVLPEVEFLYPTNDGVMKGFIDLCFQHKGIYYIVDWKTNILENYEKKDLEKEMEGHDYFLQAKIYRTALERYLKLFGTYTFGGVFFLFVRGPSAYHISGSL